jgi:hypothetical protein
MFYQFSVLRKDCKVFPQVLYVEMTPWDLKIMEKPCLNMVKRDRHIESIHFKI